jgi:integrase
LDGDYRPRAAVGLTGFMGLRGSEAARLKVRWLDVEAGVLHIRKSKTKAGIRDLPVPPRVMAWLVPLTIGADPEQPLLRMVGRRKYNSLFFKPEWWGRWLGDHMARVTGRSLPAKCLRKTFSTWADEARLDPRWIVSYLGHRDTHLPKVTMEHYRQRGAIEALRPAAAVISGHMDRALAEAAFHPPHAMGSLHDFPTFDLSAWGAKATG